MYLVNESSKLEPVNRVYKIREKSQSLLDHPRNLPNFQGIQHGLHNWFATEDDLLKENCMRHCIIN